MRSLESEFGGGILADEPGLGKTVQMVVLTDDVPRLEMGTIGEDGIMPQKGCGIEVTPGEFQVGCRIEARYNQGSPQDVQRSDCWFPGVVTKRGHGTFDVHYDYGGHEAGIPAEHVRAEGGGDGEEQVWVKPVKGTLIIATAETWTQWEASFETFAPHLVVKRFLGTKTDEMTIDDMARADVVLVDLATLKREYHFAAPEKETFLRRRIVLKPQSILKKLQWWRIIVDEVQYADGTGSGHADCVVHSLEAVNRWASCVGHAIQARGEVPLQPSPLRLAGAAAKVEARHAPSPLAAW